MEKLSTHDAILAAYVVPGMPQILLSPQKNPGWQKLNQAFQDAAQAISDFNPDVLIIYSTMWPSVLGHQIQALPRIQWTHVDEVFHDLGSHRYDFAIDADLARLHAEKATARGLHCRAISYEGFPLDTGSVVALSLLNPKNIPAIIVSSNIYADRAETLVLAKSALDALTASGKKAIAIAVSTLSNRYHQEWVRPEQDRISALKDQEWNLKYLELLSQGRLEDVAQLSRQFHREARVQKVNSFKTFWWLSAMMGHHNRFEGRVLEYQPVFGTGSAVIELRPALKAARDLEFDEESPETYSGERNVLQEEFPQTKESQGWANPFDSRIEQDEVDQRFEPS